MAEFYAGQKVRITENTCGHDIERGTIVTLAKADEYADGYWDLEDEDGWVFDHDDCEPAEDEE